MSSEVDAAKKAQLAAINEEALILNEASEPGKKQTKKDFDKLSKEALKKKKDMQMKLGGGALVALLIVYAIFNSMKPSLADDRYGICYTILELNVSYPETIEVSEYRQRLNGAITLWYTHNDAFGQFRMEDISCKIRQNEETGLKELTEVNVHKIDLSSDTIASYNNSLIYLHQNPRIMNMPYALSDSLAGLYFDTSSFWNVQLNIRQKY